MQENVREEIRRLTAAISKAKEVNELFEGLRDCEQQVQKLKKEEPVEARRKKTAGGGSTCGEGACEGIALQ